MIVTKTRYCAGVPEPEAALCIGPLQLQLFLPLELGNSIGLAAQEVDTRGDYICQ
jgi:hypothetical protein